MIPIHDQLDQFVNNLIFGGGGSGSKFFGDGRDGDFDTANYTFTNILSKPESDVEDGIELFQVNSTYCELSGDSVEGSYCAHSLFRDASNNVMIRTGKKPVTAGLAYNFQVNFRMNSASYGTLTLRAIWYDANQVPLATPFTETIVTKSTTWSQVSTPLTAPAGTFYAEFALVWNCSTSITAGYHLYWDKAMVSVGTTGIQPWIPGSTVVLDVPTPDVSTLLKQYRSFRIRPGHAVAPAARCRGVVIYSQTSAIIEGTLSASGKAPLAVDTTEYALVFPCSLGNQLYYPGKGVDPNARGAFLALPPAGGGGMGGTGGGTAWQNGLGGVGGIGGRPSWWGGGVSGGGGGGGGAYDSGSDAGIKGGVGGDGPDPGVAGVAGAAAVTAVAVGNNGTKGAGASGGLRVASGGAVGSSGAGGSTLNGWGAGGGGAGVNYNSTTAPAGGKGADGRGWPGANIAIIAADFTLAASGRIASKGGAGAQGGYGDLVMIYDIAGGGGGGGGCGGGGLLVLYTGTSSVAGTIDMSGGIGGIGGLGVIGSTATTNGQALINAQPGTPGGSGAYMIRKVS